MQCPGIGDRLGCAAHVRFGHDFQKRGSGTVQIYAGHVGELVMQGFAGVFFQMGTCQIDGLDIAVFAFLFNNTVYFATDDDRFFELADLVAFGKIGIEIVFSGEDRNPGRLALRWPDRTGWLFPQRPGS